MIKNTLFDCNLGDNVIYTENFMMGTIVAIVKFEYISIKWSDDNTYYGSGDIQTISYHAYNTYESWRNVFYYETEKDLLYLKLKYERNDD